MSPDRGDTSGTDGARREFGMPSFTGDLTSAQVRLIHAYILDRARVGPSNAAKK